MYSAIPTLRGKSRVTQQGAGLVGKASIGLLLGVEEHMSSQWNVLHIKLITSQ